mmetsp:Transcript_33359/g.72885  ORF Transcript_33359/g.72885 Transcript_33359/m.72885 type:complete len:239 (-) Transcript_33359:4234-4950(-)
MATSWKLWMRNAGSCAGMGTRPQGFCTLPSRSAFAPSFFSCCSKASYVRMRLCIWSQSTSKPSNSGPSTHTNLVFPPTVTRHPPHIPVPSTMTVFNETVVGMLCCLVTAHTPRIIPAGPMATTLATLLPAAMYSSRASVTRLPVRLSPPDPSSVTVAVLSAYSAMRSPQKRRSLVRAPMMLCTWLPANLSARWIGYTGAMPTPPPMHTTAPASSGSLAMGVPWPRGPATSSSLWPGSS